MRLLNSWRPPLTGFGSVGISLLLAAGLLGCDKNKQEESQIVARVNSDEISIHQLNFAISQAPTRMVSKSERDALLEKMIDRQLALQEALAQKLDRRPEVMLRLEEARRDILAAAYAEGISGKLDAPKEDAAARYFAEHPGLFGERKIYRLREISIPEGSPLIAEALARLERKENLVDIIAWMRQKQESFSDQLVMRPAEQLPIEIADRLLKTSPGDTIGFRLPNALLIYELQSSEPAPLPWKEAAPIIQSYLKQQQATAAIKTELKRLRSTAKISQKPLSN